MLARLESVRPDSFPTWNEERRSVSLWAIVSAEVLSSHEVFRAGGVNGMTILGGIVRAGTACRAPTKKMKDGGVNPRIR